MNINPSQRPDTSSLHPFSGSKLLEQALIFAKEKECQRITLLTDHDNTLAHTFYQNHGFDLSTMVVFRQSLDF